MIQPMPYIFPSLAALATKLSGVYSDKIKKVGNTFPQPNFSNGSPYFVKEIAETTTILQPFRVQEEGKNSLS